MSLRLYDNCKPFFVLFCFVENDPFPEVDSFNLLAGGLEIALGSDEHKCAKKLQDIIKNIILIFPPRSKFMKFVFCNKKN